MKKVYLGLFALTIAGTVSAQIGNQQRDVKRNLNIGEVSPKTSINHSKAAPFWTDNFSTPSNWVISNAGASGTPPHTLGDWAITTDVNAIPVAALKPAGHATAANGYALINSDGAGSGQTQNSKIVTANVINCSGKANVSIRFQQSTRHYQESYYVIVSNDGGATWTDFQVNTTMAVNSNSANPGIVQVNISSVAANQANVKVGFKYYGNYDWFWAVDDVEMFVTDDYDLAINGLYWGAEGSYGARLPYYSTPVAQIAPINFGGVIENKGAATQSNCVFDVAITSASYTSNSAPGTLAPNGIDTLDATATFTPGGTAATYAVTSGITGQIDANSTDNTFNSLTFATNSYVYARDAQTMTSGSYNQGAGYEMGNIFDMYANATLKGADIYIHPNTNVGAEIYATIYSIDANTGDFVYIAATPLHTVTTAELNTVVTLVFNGGQSLTAGEPYLLVAGSYGDGGATDDFVVGTSGLSEAQTTFYLDGNDNTGTWYYSTSTPMVRMNFNPTLSIDENELNASVNVFPNPAVNEVKISANDNNVTGISIVDVTGKVVYTSTVNGLAEVTVNTANFSAGMYTVNIETAAGIATKKLTIRK